MTPRTDRNEIEVLAGEVAALSERDERAGQPLGPHGWSSADYLVQAINLQTRAVLLLVEQTQRIANAVTP